MHDAAEARGGRRAARGAGFDNVNLDLMYGLPDDDVDGALADLERGLALAPAHLSWYQLTLEPNTAFERRPPPLPGDDVVARIGGAGRALLAAHGFARYEVSAYARAAGAACTTSTIGSSATTWGSAPARTARSRSRGDGAIARRAKTRNPRTYLQRPARPMRRAEERVASAPQAALEFLMNALRM